MSMQSVAAEAHEEVTHRASQLRSWRFQIGLFLALLVTAGLAWLARTVTYFPVDLQITRALQSVQAPAVQQFFHGVSWIGYPPQSNYIFGTMILGFLVVRLWREAVGLFFAAAGSAGLWFLLSPLIDRPRPSPDLVHVAMQLPSGGFPSGHVLNLTAIFGFLVYLSIVLLADVRWRALLVSLMAMPVLFIGAARVYDGAHWASDVLGGYLIGGIWLTLTILLYRWIGEQLAARRGARTVATTGTKKTASAGYNVDHDGTDQHGDITRPGNAPA
jgi:membrane-associated phospholipid phosphatase